MNLSCTVSYALQAAVLLGDSFEGTPVPSSRLAAEGGMPDRFLLQILRSLVAAGLLRSTRGVVGGYMLARPPAKITILQIVEALDGPRRWSLPMAEKFPKRARKQLQGLLGEVDATAQSQMAAVTLADLMEPRRRRSG